MRVRHYLLLDRIKIENANAVSSPITYGFPAVSGFVGAMHALSRKISAKYKVSLNGVMVACHTCDVKNYRPHDFADYRFNQTRNPIKKDGKTASIVEEGKVHLVVSLVVEVVSENRNALREEQDQLAFVADIQQKILQQRIAGGSVQSINQVKLFIAEDYQDIIQRLVPAFVLMDAQQDLIAITQVLQQENPQATALDALIETATLHHVPQADGEWQTSTVKSGRGWLVPIPVGFQGISALFSPSILANCRSSEYPSQYVECLYGLGKWVFPYRLTEIFSQGFWRYRQTEPNLYLFSQITN